MSLKEVIATRVASWQLASSTSPAAMLAELGVGVDDPASWPFVGDDVTAGSETELQAAVIGPRNVVDLPRTILQSQYLRNIARRAGAGDTSERVLTALERWLDDNPEGVWESAWVRFPAQELSSYACTVFDADLRADKRDRRSPCAPTSTDSAATTRGGRSCGFR